MSVSKQVRYAGIAFKVTVLDDPTRKANMGGLLCQIKGWFANATNIDQAIFEETANYTIMETEAHGNCYVMVPDTSEMGDSFVIASTALQAAIEVAGENLNVDVWITPWPMHSDHVRQFFASKGVTPIES